MKTPSSATVSGLRRMLLLSLVILPGFPLVSGAADGVFARFQLLEPSRTNWYVEVDAYLHVEPWRLAATVWPTNAHRDSSRRIPPGQFSEWFDIRQWAGAKLHPRLSRSGGVAEFTNIGVTFLPAAPAAAYRVAIELATAPTEKAIVRRFEETLESNRTTFLVSPTLAQDAAELETLGQMADRHLRWAREATGGRRVAPTNLLLQTSFWGAVPAQDVEAVWLLGFNLAAIATPELRSRFPELRQPAGHHWVDFGPHLTREQIEEQIRGPASKTKPSDHMNLFGFSDEVVCHPPIGTNRAALTHFHEWLAARGIPPRELGTRSWSEVVPIETPSSWRERQQENPRAANRVFYFTCRFRQASATERLRWLTESFHRHAATNAFTTTLVADHPYFSGTGLGMGMHKPNPAWGGWPLALDWFDLARQRAVDVAGVEDWMGIQYMYGPNYSWEGPQLMGFQTAIFRSGSRGQMPVMAWITPSNETNFLLKATSALAQGAKHLFFWTYGPTCLSTENYWSDLRGAYDGIARYARQLAAAEHLIAPGTTRPTRVALLYSISADYWQPFGYIHMLERRATYLALVHHQYLVDLLTEEDIADGRLRHYDLLYATDPNLTEQTARAIEEWVRRGGWLYGACGAGSRNEFDEPVPGLARAFGIAPSIEATVQDGPYHIRGGLNGLTYSDEITMETNPDLPGTPARFGVLGVRLRCAPDGGRVVGRFSDGSPAAILNRFGRGGALYFAGCPGLAYLKEARFVPTDLQEQYPPDLRQLLTALARRRDVPRLVELSQDCVEAGLYDGPSGSALALANFTYRPIPKLTVRVPLQKPIRSVRSVQHGPLPFQLQRASSPWRQQGWIHVAIFDTPLGLNDIILLERRSPSATPARQKIQTP